MADMDMLRLVAAKTGLGMKYVSKEARVSEMIGALSEAFGDGRTVMKGGTALNRLYIRKRFSEDIDLDTTLGKAEIGRRMRQVGGFAVEGPRMMGRILRYDCRYGNEFGERDRIMVEFSPLDAIRAAARPQKQVMNSFIMPTEASAFMSYSLEDMLAQKMKALSSREDGKDVFDLFYALDAGYRKGVLSEALVISGFGDLEKAKAVLRERLQEMKGRAKHIGNSTNHFIPADIRPDWNAMMDTLSAKIERM